jgi:type IV secretory pathway protease TraF
MGRPLSSWGQCRRLADDELFLLSVTNPASFDSRYFGPINASAVIGLARPLAEQVRR